MLRTIEVEIDSSAQSLFPTKRSNDDAREVLRGGVLTEWSLYNESTSQMGGTGIIFG